MPVILSPGDYDAWLNPGEHDSSNVAYLFDGFDELASAAVNPIINNARNEGPDCIAEVSLQ
jgi:putative SOS response-associated peptidase YedK